MYSSKQQCILSKIPICMLELHCKLNWFFRRGCWLIFRKYVYELTSFAFNIAPVVKRMELSHISYVSPTYTNFMFFQNDLHTWTVYVTHIFSIMTFLLRSFNWFHGPLEYRNQKCYKFVPYENRIKSYCLWALLSLSFSLSCVESQLWVIITLMCKVAVSSVSPRTYFRAILCVSLYISLCWIVGWWREFQVRIMSYCTITVR